MKSKRERDEKLFFFLIISSMRFPRFKRHAGPNWSITINIYRVFYKQWGQLARFTIFLKHISDRQWGQLGRFTHNIALYQMRNTHDDLIKFALHHCGILMSTFFSNLHCINAILTHQNHCQRWIKGLLKTLLELDLIMQLLRNTVPVES